MELVGKIRLGTPCRCGKNWRRKGPGLRAVDSDAGLGLANDDWSADIASITGYRQRLLAMSMTSFEMRISRICARYGREPTASLSALGSADSTFVRYKCAGNRVSSKM